MSIFRKYLIEGVLVRVIIKQRFLLDILEFVISYVLIFLYSVLCYYLGKSFKGRGIGNFGQKDNYMFEIGSI